MYCFINTCFLFQSNSLSILSFSFSLILYQYFLSTSLSIISFSFSLLLYPYFLSHSVYFFINTTFLIQSINLILYQNVRSLPVLSYLSVLILVFQILYYDLRSVTRIFSKNRYLLKVACLGIKQNYNEMDLTSDTF